MSRVGPSLFSNFFLQTAHFHAYSKSDICCCYSALLFKKFNGAFSVYFLFGKS